ncbi:MAG: thiamine pyrophosphate-binding protein, partial [Opitutales bacterium]|nr:thiamine pyrophosphate-binding protein [Opitutales bacterium]
MASINRANTNSLWSSVLVESLHQCGLRHVVISPGSRSTPLTMAFASHPGIEAIPVLDERSAGFFALGLAKQTHKPVALVCTSGTAAVNYFPAVVEASEGCIPLLVLTADRPHELRNCGAGQTIDQIRLYGNYPVFEEEMALPSVSMDSLE